MARIRSVKPEIWKSPQVMNLAKPIEGGGGRMCRDARLLFLGLITQADDAGRGVADPRALKASIFPGDDDITSARIVELLADVEREGLAVTYDANGHGRLYVLPTFREHQYIQKPKKSVYPPLSRPESGNLSGTSNGSVSDAYRGIGSDRIGSEGSQTRARAVDHDPVDKPAVARPRRTRLKKQSDPEQIEQRRREADAIVKRLAAGKRPS